MSGIMVRASVMRGDFTLDVDIASGAQITLLQGPSGAGKTLTLHLIAGLIFVPDAKIVLNGQDLSSRPAHRRGLSMAFQEPRLFPHLSVRRNILSSSGDKAKLPALAEALDIAALLERRPADLSGGQAQRVSLARALLPDSAALLLDEPFTGLDAERRAAVTDLLRVQTRPVIMVSHDPRDTALPDTQIVQVSGGRAR